MATPLVQRKATLPIHFFKSILETNVERIKIPNKFTRRYGGGLSNPVFLRPPDFKEWKVHWTKENGEVWFEKGWKEFAENYSLDQGHFVLFKYQGTSLIDVLILGHSALEIDYPSFDSDYEMGTLDQSDDESDEFLNVNPAEQKARSRSPLVSSQPCKKMRSGRHQNVERNSNLQKLDADAVVHCEQGAKFRKSVKHQPKGEKVIQRTSSLNTPKILRVKKVAKNFVSNNVFFTVLITRSHLEEGAWKGVPKFLDNERKEQDVMFQIGNRLWRVKLTYRGLDRKFYRFSSGWYLFAKESKLEAGDICIFELIEPDVPLLKVHVYKS